MLGTAVAPLKHPFARAKVKATVNLSGRGGSRTTDRTP